MFEAEREQLQLARTLQAVGALLTAEMELDEVFEHIFDLLDHVAHYDSVAIQLIEDGHARLAAGRGFPDLALSARIVDAITTPTLEERWGKEYQRFIVIPDTHTDPHWIRGLGNEYIRSWIGAALRVKGRLLGILNVDSATSHAYDQTIGETVAAFANQAAIAIENAQLHETVRRHASELEQRVIERTAELDRERQLTQAILDGVGEGIIFTDAEGVIEYLNPAAEQITGYTLSEALGQATRIWSSDRTLPAAFHEMWRLVQQRHSWQGEITSRRKDGSTYESALTINPITNAQNEIIGYVGVQRDITRRKELERLKDQFVSNVSHELRTPLANVKLYLGLLERGRADRRSEYMQTLHRETNRLEKLIEDLLDISRLDMGTVPIRLTPIDLNQLLEQLIADRTAMVTERGLTIEFRPKRDLPPALADSAMLTQVVSNLMTNAINYTPRAGIVSMSTTKRQVADQIWITITIRDTGPGITVADLPHLFERFYRGEAGRRSGAPGTGLGLAICREIVDRLEGRITLDSQPGQGAAFTVWLRPAQDGVV